MTGFVILGCVGLVSLTILLAVTIVTQAWERIRRLSAENWVTVQREAMATNARSQREMGKIIRGSGDDG